MRPGFKQRSLQRFLTAALLLAPTCVWAQLKCDNAMIDGVLYGTIRADYVHTHHYTIDLLNQSPVADQCDLGTCNFESWKAKLEAERLGQGLPAAPISDDHLAVNFWRAKIFEAIDLDPDFSKKIDIGYLLTFSTSVTTSRDYILRSGTIPQEQWKGGQVYKKNPIASRLTEYFGLIVGHLKWAEKHESDPDRITQLREAAKNEVDKTFKNVAGLEFVGDAPVKFMYQNKEYTQQSWEQEYYPPLTKPLVKMEVHLDGALHTIVEPIKEGSISPEELFIKTDIDELERVIIELLKKKQNVSLDYLSDFNYIDRPSGIASINAFFRPRNIQPLSRAQSSLFLNYSKGGGHAAQIVGVELDPNTGRILKLKIKNSGGDNAFDSGYIHMDDDYFRHFAIGISFPKDAGIVLPQAGP